MREPFNALRSRYLRLAIPAIWVAIALSLILHTLALFGRLPRVPAQPLEDPRQGRPSGSLAVRLLPPPSPPPSAAPAPTPAPRPAPSIAPQPPAPRVLALERAAPATMAPPPSAAARAPANDDLAAYIEARRRARAPAPAPAPSRESQPAAPPAESEKERQNRIVTANLGLNETPSFGSERMRGGGIFQIQRMGYSEAEFLFFGWNKFIKRNSQQTVEVRRGDNPSMEIAVVRKMISIIREHASDDFVWQSQRLGRDISLSARAADNAGLEEFMMREFFPGFRSRN